ncbi:XRE family transcriptional regulator [Bacteroides sp. 224]|uniref:XRE family transcriptional regulator n=1 Tax=Bacteroides sp. 224 TaxID=2302936 RepID=UPI0013D3C088|nr:XRE family transcriptional regulator [Bacteroides sp. 224]NDV65443.1 XRE family transcriptional regulator [Bacteroides sp. 224]
MDKEIHIGELIKIKMKEEGRSVSWLASKMHCDRTNVYKIFQKASIDSAQLLRISCLLGCDFFSNYSNILNRNKGNGG